MENNELQRGLSARQMQMIALGEQLVSVCLWGQQVQSNGLAHQLFCILNRWYIFIPNYESNGEMIYLNPTTGSFATFASDYIHQQRVI